MPKPPAMPASDVETFKQRPRDRPLLKTVFAPQGSGDRGSDGGAGANPRFGHLIDGFTNRQAHFAITHEDYTTDRQHVI